MRDLDARMAADGPDARKGQRAFLAKHGLLSPEERVAVADRIRTLTPSGVTQSDNVEMIRKIRDGRVSRI
jgi:hypothetical protein